MVEGLRMKGRVLLSMAVILGCVKEIDWTCLKW